MLEQMKAINNKLLYSHSGTIWRQSKEQQPDGSVKPSWAIVLEHVPCKLSKKSLDSAEIKEDVKPIKEAFTLFCDSDVAIRAGDLIEVEGKQFLAGEPLCYSVHQEINLARRDLA